MPLENNQPPPVRKDSVRPIMNITMLKHPKFSNWLKRRTEGEQTIMRWISYTMIFSVLLVFIIGYPAGQTKLDWRFYGTVLDLAVLLVLNILWYQSIGMKISRQRIILFHWGFNIASEAMVLGAILLTGRYEVVFLLFMQIAQFAAYFGVWPNGAICAVLNLAATLGILASFGDTGLSLFDSGSQLLIGMVFVLVFVLLIELSTKETQRAEGLLKDLQAVNFELKTAQQKEKELAIAEERMRLARDIHDGLGHHLTVLSVQLQAADKLVERNPRAATEAIRLCRVEAQAALEEVRRSVGMMRQTAEESRPLSEMLSSLIHDFDEHTGLTARFEQTGSPLELSNFTRNSLPHRSGGSDQYPETCQGGTENPGEAGICAGEHPAAGAERWPEPGGLF